MCKIEKGKYITLLERVRNLTQTEDEILLKVITDRILRKYSEMRPPKYISKEVLLNAEKLGINVVINKHSDVLVTRKKGLKIRFEHSNSISSLVKRVLQTNEPIKQILDDNIVSIIMEEEDAKLNKNNYKVFRGDDFRECYKSIGIELFEYWIVNRNHEGRS